MVRLLSGRPFNWYNSDLKEDDRPISTPPASITSWIDPKRCPVCRKMNATDQFIHGECQEKTKATGKFWVWDNSTRMAEQIDWPLPTLPEHLIPNYIAPSEEESVMEILDLEDNQKPSDYVFGSNPFDQDSEKASSGPFPEKVFEDALSFDLKTRVKFTLTELGEKILNEAKEFGLPKEFGQEDSDGFVTMSLWQALYLFGPHLTDPELVPCNNIILIESTSIM